MLSINHFLRWLVLACCIPAGLIAQPPVSKWTDHHVHLQDSATIQFNFRMLEALHRKPERMDSLVLDADSIIHRLDKAKFQSAWILSSAYWFGSPIISVDNEYEQVKRQNDWIIEQAARYPDRLFPFISVNPLKPYAVEEIVRAASNKSVVGLKMHFANSRVNLLDTAQLKQVQQVFTTANQQGLVILLHLRSGKKWNGNAHTQVFLEKLIPLLTNTKIVVAHLAGWGGYDDETDHAFARIARYNKQKGINSHHIYLEMGAVFPFDEEHKGQPVKLHAARLALLKRRIKEMGIDRILFGTDWPYVDMQDYVNTLTKELGSVTVQQILNNDLPPVVRP